MLVPQIAPDVAMGLPIGVLAIKHLPPETFRRVSMSFDAAVVSFGMATVLRGLQVVESRAAYLVIEAFSATGASASPRGATTVGHFRVILLATSTHYLSWQGPGVEETRVARRVPPTRYGARHPADP